MNQNQAVNNAGSEKPAEPVSKKSKAAPEIHICEEFCKGCDICVDACPQNCLAMEGGKVAVVNAAACTACGLCEMRCPDFAIWIGDFET